MISLKTLAAELGLSPTTVSRALNGFPEVGEATRRRVREAAERSGYKANATARRLATGRADAFGIVFSSDRQVLDSPIVGDFLSGLGEAAAERSFELLLCPVRQGEEIPACRRLVAGGAVDALIAFSSLLAQDGAEELLALDFPIVVHGRPPVEAPVAFLAIDNVGAFERATEHLIGLGHRRLALLNGDEGQTYAFDRRAGFVRALHAAGLGEADAVFFSGQHVFTQGLEATRRMLAAPKRPTGLVCSSILMALGAMKAVREAGLAVPGDLSIVAHDDEVAALPPELGEPALTTVHSSIRAAGARMAELAVRRIAGETASSLREIWPTALTVRGSSAPPR